MGCTQRLTQYLKIGDSPKLEKDLSNISAVWNLQSQCGKLLETLIQDVLVLWSSYYGYDDHVNQSLLTHCSKRFRVEHFNALI